MILKNANDQKAGGAYHSIDWMGTGRLSLVIGGSLGARTINQSLLQKLGLIQRKWHTADLANRQVLLSRISKKQLEGKDQSDIRLCEFIKEMSLAYAASDVVISRAGALIHCGTVSGAKAYNSGSFPKCG